MGDNASERSAASKSSAPRHRGDLEVYPQRRRGSNVWVIKDPISLRYFQFSENEFAIFRWLDGTRRLQEVMALHRGRFSPARLTLGQLRGFVATLYRRGLLIPASSGQSEALWLRSEKARRGRRFQAWANPLAVRLPGIDPSFLVERLYSVIAFCFTRSFLSFVLVFVLAAIVILATSAEMLVSRLPSINAFFNPFNLMLLSVAIAFTKLLHELGHALTARHFGARCQEMGLMLLVFTPCLYCDVTDGWKLPSRLHRVAISAAGILVEVVLASVCGLLWCVTEPGPFHSMLFNIMVVCSVGTVLINANPLLRYDGYYILSDVLDRPNLWQTSRRELNQFIQRVVGLAKIDRSGSKPTTDRLQLAYAIASSVYRVIVLLTVGWFVLQVCSQYGITVIGYGMVLMVAGGVLGPPSYRVVDSMRDPTLRKRLHRPRFLLSLCVAAGGLLFASFVPLPSRVNAAARIRPLDARKVYVSVPGTLVESIRPGERVHEGQQLARLENLQVERELHEVRSKAALQQARLLHLQSLRNESEALAAQIPAAEQQLIELRSEVEQLEKDREALILRAPLDGRVLEPSALPRSEREYPELAFWEGTPLDRCNLGAFLTRQTLLCSVNPSDRVEAELYVDQFDVGRVQEGQYVRLCVESHGGRFLEGEVIRISRTVADRIPNELVAGKRIAPEANRAKPETPMYRVLVRLDSTEAPLIPGATAQAKVSVTSQTLAAQLFRLLKRTFRLSSL